MLSSVRHVKHDSSSFGKNSTAWMQPRLRVFIWTTRPNYCFVRPYWQAVSIDTLRANGGANVMNNPPKAEPVPNEELRRLVQQAEQGDRSVLPALRKLL